MNNWEKNETISLTSHRFDIPAFLLYTVPRPALGTCMQQSWHWPPASQQTLVHVAQKRGTNQGKLCTYSNDQARRTSSSPGTHRTHKHSFTQPKDPSTRSRDTPATTCRLTPHLTQRKKILVDSMIIQQPRPSTSTQFIKSSIDKKQKEVAQGWYTVSLVHGEGSSGVRRERARER
jgi:hypothetical protein